jgi:hypothetical protein
MRTVQLRNGHHRNQRRVLLMIALDARHQSAPPHQTATS